MIKELTTSKFHYVVLIIWLVNTEAGLDFILHEI